MDEAEQFLTALQLGDSFFPSGAFAYSSGLETFVSEGLVCDRERLVRFIESYLLGLVARCDLLFVKLSRCFAAENNVDEIVLLDGLAHAAKPVMELREASMQMGRQVLSVMKGLHPSPLIQSLWQGLGEKRLRGHHPVVFGAICGCIGLEPESTMLTYLYAAVSSLVSAGVRLIPIGHSDGQAAIGELRALMSRVAAAAGPLGKEHICTFAPALEVRAMQHEDLFTRLFKS